MLNQQAEFYIFLFKTISQIKFHLISSLGDDLVYMFVPFKDFSRLHADDTEPAFKGAEN